MSCDYDEEIEKVRRYDSAQDIERERVFNKFALADGDWNLEVTPAGCDPSALELEKAIEASPDADVRAFYRALRNYNATMPQLLGFYVHLGLIRFRDNVVPLTPRNAD